MYVNIPMMISKHSVRKTKINIFNFDFFLLFISVCKALQVQDESIEISVTGAMNK